MSHRNLYFLYEALNSLKYRPSLALTIILTLGMTLATLIVAMSINYVLLQKPLPYPQQDKLYVLQHGLYDDKQTLIGNMFPYPSLMALYQDKSLFEQSALVSYYSDLVQINDRSTTQNLSFSTPELGQLLGIPMVKGRFFASNEGVNNASPVAVISFAFWQDSFALTPDILEQFIEFKGVRFRIIGVTSEDFIEPELMTVGRQSQIWLPWGFEPTSDRIKNAWGMIHAPLHFITKQSSLRSATARAEQLTESVNRRWQKEVVGLKVLDGWSVTMRLVALNQFILGDNTTSIVILLAAAFGLFLLCTINIINLFIAGAVQKQRELAVRVAIGMKQRSLFRLMLCEASILMGLSLLFALLVAGLEVTLIKTYLVTYWPRLNELAIDGVMLFSGFFISALLAMLFAWISSKQINSRKLMLQLKASGKGSAIQTSKSTRNIIATVQISTVCVFVFFSCVLLTQAANTIYKPLGFTQDNLLAMRFNSLSLTPPTREESHQFMTELKTQLLALPQVNSLSQSTSPFNDYAISAINLNGHEEPFSPHIKWVDHQYFEVIEQPLVFGRSFNSNEIKDNADVVVINSTLAQTLLHGDSRLQNIIGQYLSIYSKPHRIIGIVEASSLPNQAANTGRLFMTASKAWTSLLVATTPLSSITDKQLNQIAQQIDRRFALSSFEQVQQQHTHFLFMPIVTSILAIILTLLIIVFSFIGLHSIMHYQVKLRQVELATHLAIGAKYRDLVWLLLKENAYVTLFGLCLASVAILAILNLNISQLSELSVMQLFNYGGGALMLILAVVFVSCLLPLNLLKNGNITTLLRQG